MQFNFEIEEIKYIKILYKDLQNNPNVIQAALRKIDDINLYACTKIDQEISLKVPQEVVLSIICKDGLYRTKTVLTKIEHDLPYTYIILGLPQGLEYQQNREYFRVVAQYPCKYVCRIDDINKEYQTETCNISANGVSIIVPELIVSEEECELSIVISGCVIELKAQYVRSEKFGDTYRVSFKYSNISNMDRDFIAQACIKKQLEEKRKYMN